MWVISIKRSTSGVWDVGEVVPIFVLFYNACTRLQSASGLGEGGLLCGTGRLAHETFWL